MRVLLHFLTTLVCAFVEDEEQDEIDENSIPRIKCVDLRNAYSVFDGVKKVPLPNNWEATDGYGLTRELWGIIQYSPRWYITLE